MQTHFQAAVEELGAYATPILTLRKDTQSPFLVGTGTLYRSENEIFLVTAKHVVDELEDGLIVTSGRNGFIRFAAEMAAFEYTKGSGRDHDICVARLPPEAARQLHTHLRVVEENQVSIVSTYDKLTVYAFVGYPHSKNKPKPKSVVNQIELKPYYYVLREFHELRKLSTTDKNHELHVAFEASLHNAKDVDLQRNIRPPAPYGISGCGVWMIKLNKISGVVDQRALVAVGIEYIQRDKRFHRHPFCFSAYGNQAIQRTA